MNIQRGDVLKARFPHAARAKGKKRPVVVVQAETYNQRLRHAVVAQFTSNMAEKDDDACVLIEAATVESRAGLSRVLALADKGDFIMTALEALQSGPVRYREGTAFGCT